MLRRPLAVALCVAAVLLTALAPSASAAVPSKRQWLADVGRAMNGSRIYIDDRTATGDRQLAVNFDIDNTALESHYAYGKAVPVVLRFAKYAAAHHVSLLFNTGRLRGDQVRQARSLLRRAGYPVTAMCGRTSSHEGLAHSKQRCRRHFVSQGYTIVANVGNRSTDFSGSNYERAFRLPNYRNQLA